MQEPPVEVDVGPAAAAVLGAGAPEDGDGEQAAFGRGAGRLEERQRGHRLEAVDPDELLDV